MWKYKLPYPIIKKKESTDLLIKYGGYIDSESIFFKKSIIKTIGLFNLKYTYLCDYDFFLRVSNYYDIYYTNEKLSSWRVHPDQQHNQNQNQKKERIILFFFILFKYNFKINKILKCLNIIFRNILSIFLDYINDKKIRKIYKYK